MEPSSKAEITERKIAKRIAEAGIRLRFDRVALRFLDGVKAAFDQTLPIDQSLAFTVTAPIKLPAKTSAALQERLGQLPTQGLSTTINGNGIRARMVKNTRRHGYKIDYSAVAGKSRCAAGSVGNYLNFL